MVPFPEDPPMEHVEPLVLVPRLVEPATRHWLDKFITQDLDMIEVKRQTEILSMHKDSVMICGETGTGKELIARALQGLVAFGLGDKARPFIAVNLAGLPETLIESELFGHAKGAFTDAKSVKNGLFIEAASGTLLLDECTSLPVHCQAKLLRVLQERTIRPVGALHERPIHCRIIASTNESLSSAIKHKTFREDLYWRLATFTLQLSPLRQRRGDVPLIIESLDPTHLIPPPLVDQWSHGPLMGNVRELQSNVRKYHILGC